MAKKCCPKMDYAWEHGPFGVRVIGVVAEERRGGPKQSDAPFLAFVLEQEPPERDAVLDLPIRFCPWCAMSVRIEDFT